MYLFDLFRNYLNALVGNNQQYEELLAAHDISAVKDKMETRQAEALACLKEYDTAQHAVMNRPDKIITDKKGRFVRRDEVWKLPVPYPVYINEISLVFLYGRPVKWTQQSEGTDNAFEAFKDVIKRTRFDSKIRQCKRLAGAETESAMLFRVFRDDDGQPDVQLRVLARSKGDELYTRFDQYENLLSFAWGYYVKERDDRVVYHFDIFTKDATYRCAKRNIGWDVETEPNFIGKIPVIYFRQDKEWKGVEQLIHREEYIASRTADVNDYFADPVEIISANVVKNLPEKKEAGKLLITNDEQGVDNAAKYLTWDSAPQSKKDELEWLQAQILSKTFTPNITLDTLKSVSQLSAKALRTVMMLADIKAAKHKERHDELLDRTASLITAIIGGVLDVSLADECRELVVGHEFQEPFGEDIQTDLDNIIKAVDAGILSTETATELNPLIRDHLTEMRRLSEESETRRGQQGDIFGPDIAEGAGPASFASSRETAQPTDSTADSETKQPTKQGQQ